MKKIKFEMAMFRPIKGEDYSRIYESDNATCVYIALRILARSGVELTTSPYQLYKALTENEPTRRELSNIVDGLKILDEEGVTIISTEVSRITRSTKRLCDIIDKAREIGLKLVIGSFVVDCTNDKLDAMTEGMLKMMGVFAEMERNIISERVKSGMANAREKGSKIGRPETTADKIPSVFMKYYPKYRKGEMNVTELSRLCKMSRTTVYKYIELLK